MIVLRKILFILLLFIGEVTSGQDTLTVLSYNILNYPASNATKADTLKTIIQHISPDIFMITELTSSSGATTILNDALNVDGVTSYQKSAYVNGPDTDNLLFYNANKLVLYSQFEIPTVLRNISEYVLYYNDPNITTQTDTIFIHCYMAHLKASSGSTNEQQRNQEAVMLKNYLDTKATNVENIILGGDFNVYSSTEAAYNTILSGGNVALFDPISTPGNWSGNAVFTDVHTQSTRKNFIGDGGAFGGMDDRFDFIFTSNDILNGTNKVSYIPNSYTALGNDGNHFNTSINASPTNTAVPANIANALYYMSDHLPIFIQLEIDLTVGLKKQLRINNWKGYLKNNQFYFTAKQHELQLTVVVYDVLGKVMTTNSFNNQHEFQINFDQFHHGIYFVKVVSATHQQSFKILK